MLLVCSEDQEGLKIGVQVKSRVQEVASLGALLVSVTRPIGRVE